MAVDHATHDLYVADSGNRRVDQFSATGKFIRAWGWGVVDGAEKFEVCTVACRAGIEEGKPGAFITPMFVTVDNSSGPSKGDVYVADVVGTPGLYGDDVTKFTSTGELVSTWGVAGQLDGSTTPGGLFKEIVGIATSASGDLLVLNRTEGASHTRVSVFFQDGPFQEEFLIEHKPIGALGALQGVAVDDSGGLSSGDIYALQANNNETLQFNSAGQFLSTPALVRMRSRWSPLAR